MYTILVVSCSSAKYQQCRVKLIMTMCDPKTLNLHWHISFIELYDHKAMINLDETNHCYTIIIP